jgi:hypothetical protein
MNGLFCANFVSSRQCWSPCHSVWCGSCYTPHPLDRFHRFIPVDEAGFEWRPASDQLRHMQAHDGSHLIVPFQCDLCMFRNLTGRNPLLDTPSDDLLLCCIRRVNLDAVWGREPATAEATLRAAKQLVLLWDKVGISQPFMLPARGPFPVGDSFGVGVAIAMVLKSLEPGRYATHQQFETIRKLRAGFSNLYMSSVAGAATLRTVGTDRAKHHLTDSPTQSLWFERFSHGCLLRMGQEVRQDWALPLEVVHALMAQLEREWVEATTPDERILVASIGAYSVIAFCGSFRGAEVFLVDLHGLRKYLLELEPPGTDCVIVPLLGRFKGETGDKYHLTPLAAMTSSGLKVKEWVKRLVYVREAQNRFRGPAFCDAKGEIAKSTDYEMAIMDRLVGIQEAAPHLIPRDIDIYEHFGISRSFRRGATSTARVRGVTDRQVDMINRWRSFENSKGRRPQLSMHDHYSDIRIMIPELVMFSKAL